MHIIATLVLGYVCSEVGYLTIPRSYAVVGMDVKGATGNIQKLGVIADTTTASEV
jgi:hypothetical protein